MTAYRRVLVLGGARSGKSRFAQDLAERSGLTPVLVATAEGLDEEMAARIAHHRSARSPGSWLVREEPLALPDAVAGEAGPGRVVVADCLTLWLSNLLLAEADVEAATRALTAALRRSDGPLVLVSNEVGSGIVPATSLGRLFRDAQGRLNQEVAAACDAVVLVTAGCPTLVKPAPVPDVTLG